MREIDKKIEEYIKDWSPNKFIGFDTFREYIIGLILQEIDTYNKDIWKYCEDNSFEVKESGFGEIRVVDCDGLGEFMQNKLKSYEETKI